MAVLVNSTDPRGPKAVALVAADILGTTPWTTFLDDRGRVSYAVPSSTPGLTYRVTASDCDCNDRAYRGTRCKHMLAAALHAQYDLEQEPVF
jgi:hypothetical protein